LFKYFAAENFVRRAEDIAVAAAEIVFAAVEIALID
jgi:hypothetical protein